MPKLAVFDSSVLLAVLRFEPGGDAVIPLLIDGLVSAVNVAETHARMLREGVQAATAWNRIVNMGPEICPFTPEQARIAAELEAPTRRYGLSLGDRACLALAIERKATVYTADKSWKHLGLPIEVEVIR